jgi:dTDP-4-amino-4,6-dideoxygalactose transaminase
MVSLMNTFQIPFNKPYLTGKEAHYIYQAVYNGQISGNGYFTNQCQQWFEKKYNFKKCLLTTSCTDALEMAALLINLQAGDEVIVPSYTFVSSALAFTRQGAIIKFVDSRNDHPGLNEENIENLVTPKTKAIIVVHYAGVACDMDKIMQVATAHNLFVIEDAAHAIDSFYKNKPLGGIGHFGCFSFHETKNIQCGEGGMLVINDQRFEERAEIIWEKGTNRSKFFRGEIDKYGWVDTGSSFLPSDMLAAFLLAQLEHIDEIQKKRISLWQYYYNKLLPLAKEGFIRLPYIPKYATNNGHMFYIVCKSETKRTEIIQKLKSNSILAVFHYQSLHKSSFMQGKSSCNLIQSDLYADDLLRLPFYFQLTTEQIEKICTLINDIL